MVNILFVCAGNTCRSAMAEYLLKKMIVEKKIENRIEVKSCGMFTSNNQPAAKNAIEVMKNSCSDIINHKTQIITKELIENSNYVFAMDNFIFDYLNIIFKNNIKGHVSCINKNGISDPYGKPIEEYKMCRQNIENSLKIILNYIINNEKF